MQNNLATIKFHPPKDQHSIDHNRYRRFVVICVIFSALVTIVLRQVLISFRYYIATIEVKVDSPIDGRTSLEYHLGGLILGDVRFIDPKHGAATMQRLIEDGKAYIWADKDAGKILVSVKSDSSASAQNLAELIVQNYVARFEEYRKKYRNKIESQLSKLNEQYAQLGVEKQRIESQLSKLRSKFQATGDSVTLSQIDRVQNLLKLADKKASELKALRTRLTLLRSQLSSPTITVSEELIERVRKSDPQYTGDFRLLVKRYRKYLYYLKKELKLTSTTIKNLRKELQQIVSVLSSQLELDLPSDLIDDLLELNLLLEVYDGKLAVFEDQWNRYSEKILFTMSDPIDADYTNITTVILQLKRSLLQSLGDIPSKLKFLYQRLSKANPQKRTRVSEYLIRNIVRSDIVDGVEKVVSLWNTLLYHIDNSLPNKNVHLLAMGKSCKLLQNRIKLRDRYLISKLERKLLLERKQEIKTELEKLQLAFEEKTAEIMKIYSNVASAEKKLSEVGESIPTLRNLVRNLIDIELKMAGIEKRKLKEQKPVWLDDKLSVTDTKVISANILKIPAGYENIIAVLIGIVLLVVVIVFGRSFIFQYSADD